MCRKASFIVLALMLVFLFACGGGGGGSSSKGSSQSADSPSPSQPTTPTNPTNPSDPTNPTNPTNPTDPTNPTNPPANVAPVANAGAAQSVALGVVVTLDGTGSSDPDGNYPLTYAWQMVSKPAGSQATLSDLVSDKPTFTTDKVGDYTIQLVVKDSLGLASNSASVTVSATNQAPVANAGTPQTVALGTSVTLDGSGSNDPDGNYPLAYAWVMVPPAGSQATLSDAASVAPSFTVDTAGNYSILLVVTDSFGLASDPAVVTISTLNSAPVATAGPDQTLDSIGVTVQLDGSQSYDFDNDPITYAWTITTMPSGSTATLSDPTSATPTFWADVVGEYVVQLQVSDNKGAVSTPDEVQVTVQVKATNTQPVADAGGNQIVETGNTAQLDGSKSYDIDGDALTYSWAFVSAPGSIPQLNGATTVNPTFVPDVEGDYVVSLVVNDGTVDSLPSNADILAIAPPHITDFVLACMDIVNAMNSIDLACYQNANMRETMTSKIQIAVKDYLAGKYSSAHSKLANDVSFRTDGYLSGGADGSDWIICLDAQALVYPKIQYAIGLLPK